MKIRHIFKTTFISANLLVFLRVSEENLLPYTHVYYATEIQIVRHNYNSCK